MSQRQQLTAVQTALVSRMDPRLLFLATGSDGSSLTVGATGCEKELFFPVFAAAPANISSILQFAEQAV